MIAPKRPHRNISSAAIRRPIGTIMLTSVVLVLGLFFLSGLPLDLLPRITYPQIRATISSSTSGSTPG
jgi:multidrug efflux pump subunit AcrB